MTLFLKHLTDLSRRARDSSVSPLNVELVLKGEMFEIDSDVWTIYLTLYFVYYYIQYQTHLICN